MVSSLGSFPWTDIVPPNVWSEWLPDCSSAEAKLLFALLADQPNPTCYVREAVACIDHDHITQGSLQICRLQIQSNKWQIFKINQSLHKLVQALILTIVYNIDFRPSSSMPIAFHPLRGYSGSCPHILAVFSAFYGQCSVTAAWATRSPLSI